MAGTKHGALKKKLGLKGKTKAGEMISAMNKLKGTGITKTIKKII